MSAPQPVFDRSLPNGLRVLLKEVHDAPIASFWTWYRVGSRNEPEGLSGASHWVEHMQFKGTPSLAKGQIFRDVAKHGGSLNAMTSLDWTAYYETLPADRLDPGLEIESDRMTSSLFAEDEVASERTVILAERHGSENRPQYLLYEAVLGAAFSHHPYRNMVIGSEADLRQMTRDDLYCHYRRYYHPGNAFIVAVGAFDAEELIQRIESIFGKIAPGPSLPPLAFTAEKPEQEQRLTLHRPAPTSYLRLAFRAPAARDHDLAALLVLDAVLSGGKGMGMRGGHGMGRSSRLYRALVEAGHARSASSDVEFTIDPYLFVVSVAALSTKDAPRIEQIVERELGRLRTEPIAEPELERAKKQVRAQYVYSLEGVTSQAFWLGQMEIVDRFDRADSLITEIDAVTASDILRVAERYFRPRSRIVGWLHPSEDGGGDRHGGGKRADGMTPLAAQSGQAVTHEATSLDEPVFQRSVLANGIVILGQVRPHQQSVVLRVRLEAGAILDPPEQLGRAAFTARMLTRGTEYLSFQQLNERVDSLGAVLSAHASRHFTEITVRCLQDDLDTLLGLAASIIRYPAFPEAQAAIVRQEMLAAIREQDTDTGTMADFAARRLLYPTPHPYGQRVIGELDSLPQIAPREMMAFRSKAFGPAVTTIAVVGGIPSFELAVDLIAKHLGDWTAPASKPTAMPTPPPPTTRLRAEVEITGKSQADIALAFPTIPRGDSAYYALDTANLILGRLGLMGRLGATVRDDAGLAYYVYSQVEPGRNASLWIARAGVSDDHIDRAIEAITDQLDAMGRDEVSAEELADAQSHLTGVLPLALESSEGVAATLLNIEYFDLGLDYLRRFPEVITSLTVEDLRAAIQTHVDPARLAIGVARPSAR